MRQILLGLVFCLAWLPEKPARAEDTPPAIRPQSEDGEDRSLKALGLRPLDELPVVPKIDKSKKGPNLCPVCGRSRSECYQIYIAAQTNPKLKDKVCAIYKDYGEPPMRPWLCPICQHKVNIPMRDPKYDNVDADFCPHRDVGIKYVSGIVLCPNCGFSAHRHDFMKVGKEEAEKLQPWVETVLKPEVRVALRSMANLRKDKVADEDLVDLFENQADLPDTVRCKHALLYYQRRNENAGFLAWMAWETAWACRRELSKPLYAPYVSHTYGKLTKKLQSMAGKDGDVQDKIRALNQLYHRPPADYDFFDRQVIRIMQAGLYNRMGFNQWTMRALQKAKRAGESYNEQDAQDPWYLTTSSTMPEKLRREEAALKSTMIVVESTKRLKLLETELRYLGEANKLIQAALRLKLYPVDEIPTYIYLTGEFERRREFFRRASIWLDGARLLDRYTAGSEITLASFAPQQHELMRVYIKHRGVTPEIDQREQADLAFLKSLKRHILAEKDKKATPETASQAKHLPSPHRFFPGVGAPAKPER